MKPSFFPPTAITFIFVAIGTSTLAGDCYSKNDQRDKWLADWVYWVPGKGEKVVLRGKTYTQSKAIAYAKKDIPAGFKKRGASINDSAAGAAAMDMIVAKNNARRAEKIYNKRKLSIAWENAIACWQRFKG